MNKYVPACNCCVDPGNVCGCATPRGLPTTLHASEDGYGTAWTLAWVSGCTWRGCTMQMPIFYGFFGTQTVPWELTFTYNCATSQFIISVAYNTNGSTITPMTGTCASSRANFRTGVWTTISSSIGFGPFNATRTFNIGSSAAPYSGFAPPTNFPLVTYTVTP